MTRNTTLNFRDGSVGKWRGDCGLFVVNQALSANVSAAVKTDAPKLHYLVGDDAVDNATMFEKHRLEAWVEEGAKSGRKSGITKVRLSG